MSDLKSQQNANTVKGEKVQNDNDGKTAKHILLYSNWT